MKIILMILLVIFLVGCADDSGFSCPADNKHFACRGSDNPVCDEDYDSWLVDNCPDVDILE